MLEKGYSRIWKHVVSRPRFLSMSIKFECGCHSSTALSARATKGEHDAVCRLVSSRGVLWYRAGRKEASVEHKHMNWLLSLSSQSWLGSSIWAWSSILQGDVMTSRTASWIIIPSFQFNLIIDWFSAYQLTDTRNIYNNVIEQSIVVETQSHSLNPQIFNLITTDRGGSRCIYAESQVLVSMHRSMVIVMWSDAGWFG